MAERMLLWAGRVLVGDGGLATAPVTKLGRGSGQKPEGVNDSQEANYGPCTFFGVCWCMLYGPKCVVHLVLKEPFT